MNNFEETITYYEAGGLAILLVGVIAIYANLTLLLPFFTLGFLLYNLYLNIFEKTFSEKVDFNYYYLLVSATGYPAVLFSFISTFFTY
mmetsp:Transcript_4329/g.662  ORF Transcript_4329/g.662 Transcript_4329/m.662 type:complete len:88 (-) Transcript_4329:132-395(-)